MAKKKSAVSEVTVTFMGGFTFMGHSYRFARTGEYVIGVARVKADGTYVAVARNKCDGDGWVCECRHRTAKAAARCLGRVRACVR